MYYVGVLFGGFKGGEVRRGQARSGAVRRRAVRPIGIKLSLLLVGLCECCSPGEARS